MPATRTQVHFTAQQRQALDELAARKQKTLAEVGGEAMNAYPAQAPDDPEATLDQTIGSIPGLPTPTPSP